MKKYVFVLMTLFIFSCERVIVEPDPNIVTLNEFVEIGKTYNNKYVFAQVRLKNNVPYILFWSRDLCLGSGSRFIASLIDDTGKNGSIIQFIQFERVLCDAYLENHLISHNFDKYNELFLNRMIFKDGDTALTIYITNKYAFSEIFAPLM